MISMRVASSDRLQADLLRLVHRGCGPRDFARAASRILDRAIPFDGLCILTMDPATRLATSAYVENGLREAEAARIAEIEYSEPDFNQFGTLARSGRLAASLDEATGGRLDRSLRHRELREPHDMGDELRALLGTGEATWGSLTLGRRADLGPFTHAEVELVMSVSAHLAEGLRRAMLLTSLPSAPDDEEGAAGLVLVAPDSSIVRADAAATKWLAELGTDGLDTPLPAVVMTAASRARSIATGH